MKRVSDVIGWLQDLELYVSTIQRTVEVSASDYWADQLVLVLCTVFTTVINFTWFNIYGFCVNVLPFIWEFSLYILLWLWFMFWLKFIKTLRYRAWFSNLMSLFLNSNFITTTVPKVKKVVYLYLSYFSAYKKIVRSNIDINYSFFSSILKRNPNVKPFGFVSEEFKNWLRVRFNFGSLKPVKWESVVKFIHKTLIFIPNPFKFGNRKQAYFKNYFNSKKRYNNWIWKWRK